MVVRIDNQTPFNLSPFDGVFIRRQSSLPDPYRRHIRLSDMNGTKSHGVISHSVQTISLFGLYALSLCIITAEAVSSTMIAAGRDIADKHRMYH
jgi:hypothetical protein